MCNTSFLTDTEVTLKRNLYETDHGELTRKDKSARNARVDCKFSCGSSKYEPGPPANHEQQKHSRFRSITHQSEWALPPWDHRALLVAQYVPTLQYTFEP